MSEQEIAIVTFKLSEISNVDAWQLFLDEVPQTMHGKQRQLRVTKNVEHTIRYTFQGSPSGTMNSKLFHQGEVVKHRTPAKIPATATSSYDRFKFTIGV